MSSDTKRLTRSRNDRWLAGMRRFQDLLYPEGPLPGDAIIDRKVQP